jgi:hypothetical protein
VGTCCQKPYIVPNLLGIPLKRILREPQYNRILREAFESSIGVLGTIGKNCLIQELERLGGYSTYADSDVSLPEIASGLQKLFGEGIAEVLMEDILIKMDELYTPRHVKVR